MIADRANDNTSVPDTYRPLTTPGVWVPTTPPITREYARAKPWGFERPDQFRPGPPPALNSVQYARDYNEPKSLAVAKRRAHERAVRRGQVLESAQYHGGLAPGFAPDGYRPEVGLAECARLFAIMTMANANSFIVDWDAKFHYNFWRPVTAIRNGDNDGNDRLSATQAGCR